MTNIYTDNSVVIANMQNTIDEQKALIHELSDLLIEARDDVAECLGNDIPNKGWLRFDRRIKYRQNHLAKIDEALAKAKALPSEKG